ncbi:MAG TPA: FG-GAP-like repeat-containing protein [Gammaproteobacteria bacterium]|nr:FG-GAP-like repeat-containing protein [Gammaproteobacteria bacterium]
MKLLYRLILSLVIIGLTGSFFAPAAHAASNERMMDDSIFDTSRSMEAGDIQNFLNQFPNSCLKNYSDEFPYDYFNYSGSASAAVIIRRASDLWGVNPRVLLAKLEVEENMVTGSSGCAAYQYASAMGFDCPGPTRQANYRGTEITTCVQHDSAMGFARQVTKGGWTLKWAKERANDNLNWLTSDDAPTVYHGSFVSAGMHKRCGSCDPIYDDGTFQGVDVQTGATASFYNYTPFLNQSVDNVYEGWWGSTITGHCLTSSAPPASSTVLFHKYVRNVDFADLNVYSGTTTDCIESHIWNPGMGSWNAHIASNQPIINYPDLQVLYGDLDGSGLDYPVLFGLRNTSTGMVESHVWSHDMSTWLAHAASNQPAVNPADCKILMADLYRQGKDQVILVCERNTTSHKIEFHVWGPGMQSWQSHVITNMPEVDPTQNTILSGDVDGDGTDELILVAYNHTGSGKIEFHIWNQGQWSWRSHIATNMPEVDPNISKVEFGDIDGNKVDEAVLVALKTTGSGKIEFHVWDQGMQSWRSHIASNQPTL